MFAETLHQLGIGGYKRHATNHSVDVWLLSMLSVGVLFFFPLSLREGQRCSTILIPKGSPRELAHKRDHRHRPSPVTPTASFDAMEGTGNDRCSSARSIGGKGSLWTPHPIPNPVNVNRNQPIKLCFGPLHQGV